MRLLEQTTEKSKEFQDRWCSNASARALAENPELGSPADEDLRYFVLRRFPFSVVCSAMPGLIYVVVVAHGSREPGYWQRRVQER